jgi:Endonuclease/Exonuclease/phosphatase family
MKRLFVTLAITCFYANYCTAQIARTPNAAKPDLVSAIVGFYNLENLFDTVRNPLIEDIEFTPGAAKQYNTAIYTKKINNMAKVISQIGIDVNPDGLAILGVAEIENDTVLTDLILSDSLAGRGYQYVHFNSPDGRGIDVALLYSPKYFTVLSKSPHTVTLPTKWPTRDILYVKGLLNGEVIHILVNHWPSRSGGGNPYDINNKENAYRSANRGRNTSIMNSSNDRGGLGPNNNQRYMADASSGSTLAMESNVSDGEEATRELRIAAGKACRGIFDSIQASEPNAKIFIMGDLNDDPSSAGVVKGLGAKGEVSKVEANDIYNPYAEIHKKGFGTLAYNGKWNLFDQIMLSTPLLNQVQDGWFLFRPQIFYRDFLINQTGTYKGTPHRTWAGDKFIDGFSDHLPVYTILLKEIK